MYKVISTGSKGNAVLYHGRILVDCGVPFSMLEPYLKDIQLVLLTHKHGDHLNRATLKRLVFERPSIRIGCCDWFEDLQGRNIDQYKIGEMYNYFGFSISPVKLYHDVPNCGYRIFKGETKIFHATDTAHLEGIEAKDYTLYCIESNYDEETVGDIIQAKRDIGKFTHEIGAINSHLSEQQARDFIFKNKGVNSQVIRLHE